MSRKILIVCTSTRRSGNSDMLADEFARGAQEAWHEVKKVCLYDRNIGFCQGCLACQKNMKCVLNDDANAVVEQMWRSEVLVFATPVYFYGMSGQMKTLLDRSNPLFPAEYAFRDIYLLAAAADTDERAVEGVVTGINGWIECFEESRLADVLCGTGADEIGTILNNRPALDRAYEMSKAVR
ncbi:MAG: flavodoxin family protein [Synergistaceae bacterium]|nr:flavodoxin family protein [Synergistaceae bacterium]